MLAHHPDVGHRRIVVKGLPLHLWSLGFFRAIGSLCGGFIRVDEATGRRLLLDEAWIWIRDGLLEKIPRIISLFDRGREFRLEICLISPEHAGSPWSENPLGMVVEDSKIKNFQIQNSDKSSDPLLG